MLNRKQLTKQIASLNNKLRSLKFKPKSVKRNPRNKMRYKNSSKPITTYDITKNVQNSSKMRNTMRLSSYGNCRLNPFSGVSMPFSGLPDGDNSKRIVLDHVAYTDFAFTSGSATFRILAGLPFNVLAQFASTSNFVATDPSSGTLTTTSYGNLNANSWVPLNTPSAYSNLLALPQSISLSTVGPYSQTKARCIGLAWRIIYTGTVSNASGLLSIRDFGAASDGEVGISSGASYVTNANNSTNTIYANSILGLTVDFPTATSSSDVGQTRFLRLDQNPWGVAKHNSQIYTWKSYREQPLVLISSAYSLNSVLAGGVIPLTTQTLNSFNAGGFNCFDDQFNCTEIKMSNVTSPIAFRLETRACWEYIVQPTSPMYSLTKSAGPRNQAQLTQVETAIQKTPPALAYNENISSDPRK